MRAWRGEFLLRIATSGKISISKLLRLCYLATLLQFEKDVYCFPMRRNSAWIASESRLLSGRERNKPIRRSSATNASRNARSICCGVPATAAGSGTPQCAVIGWPGHRGQTSFAALSQTVKTKSIFGASGFANSSQLLLRKPSVDRFAAASVFSAAGFTRPVGWLPALYAVKFGLPF